VQSRPLIDPGVPNPTDKGGNESQRTGDGLGWCAHTAGLPECTLGPCTLFGHTDARPSWKARANARTPHGGVRCYVCISAHRCRMDTMPASGQCIGAARGNTSLRLKHPLFPLLFSVLMGNPWGSIVTARRYATQGRCGATSPLTVKRAGSLSAGSGLASTFGTTPFGHGIHVACATPRTTPTKKT